VSEHILNGAIRAWNIPWFRDRYARNEVEWALYLRGATRKWSRLHQAFMVLPRMRKMTWS
jgi:hypothetical protein